MGSEKNNVDLRNIQVKSKLGGTINDIKLFNGLVFPNKKIKLAGRGK